VASHFRSATKALDAAVFGKKQWVRDNTNGQGHEAIFVATGGH
jgi:hypothetical protein